jgi:hypothetical protein
VTVNCPPGPIDWVNVYRRLMHGKQRLRIWEIDEMTEAEVALALDDDLEKPRPPSYSDAVGNDVDAYIAERRRMTHWQKLKKACGF